MVSYLYLLAVLLNPCTAITSIVEKTWGNAADAIGTPIAFQMTLLVVIRKYSFSQEIICLLINTYIKIAKMCFPPGTFTYLS